MTEAAPEAPRARTREEIPEYFTWKLSDIYPHWDAWEADLKEFEVKLSGYAELRGTLSETARIHGQNRVLIRQELAFLDHLMRVLSGTPEGAYSAAGGSSTRPQVLNLIDTRV